ncbi:exported hypothetical protein [Candidatus Contendobacter odensis Run_B_J11]|uniref:Uncharacterized protein n=1 Tax=Candidatus Contendobacter odensis Run_B_J11 TaxID=1400861 RepID=A0A7U7GDB0_9GAMM|nr:exported hypothetical protein [Candidatus Contendobacter odensis Run_B_J11]
MPITGIITIATTGTAITTTATVTITATTIATNPHYGL